MLARGFVLADVPRRVSWRAVWALVKHADRTTALFRVVEGPAAAWDTADHLLAVLVDLAKTELWAKTRDAKSGRNRPKPIRRPGETPDDETRFGNSSESVEDIDAWLTKRRENQLALDATAN